MADFLARVWNFLAELKRRQVYRVAATYAGAAFVLWQATALLVRALDWPEWVLSSVVLLAIGGFPVVVALAWMYEVSPEGIRETPEGEATGEESPEEEVRWGSRFAAGLAALLVAGSLVWLLWPHQTLAFGEGDPLVLADFRNATADSVLTGSLSTAFRIGVEQSPYLRTYPERKVDAALERMGLDPDTTRLTGDLAREVAERDGVPVAVVPAVTRLAGTYRVALSVYPAGADEPVATPEVEAGSRDDLLAALDDLAVRLREVLGESADRIARHRRPLAEVTTSSLPALKLFSRGQDEYGEGHFSEARRLFRHALEVDSSFTAARAQLGILVYEQFDRERGGEHLRVAVKNADGLTELESFAVRAFYAQAVERDLQKAADLYRSLIELYPNRAEPHNNLARMLRQSGRPREAVEHYRRALAIDSATHLYFAGLANTYLYDLGRVDSALALARRRTAMDSTYFWGWADLGWAYIGADSLEAARRAIERAVEIRPHDYVRNVWLGFVDLLSGRPRAAAGQFERVLGMDTIPPAVRYSASYPAGVALEEAGAPAEARRHFGYYFGVSRTQALVNPDLPNFRLREARALSRLGEHERAWELARETLARDSSSATLRQQTALVAAVQGKRREALRHLRHALRAGYTNYIWIRIHPDLWNLHGWGPFESMLDTLLHLPGDDARKTGDVVRRR